MNQTLRNTRGSTAFRRVLPILGGLIGSLLLCAVGRGADADEPKPGVKVFILNGAYQDNPSGADFDPMAILSGGMEKPASFFDLCEKIDAAATNNSFESVFFDLSSPTLDLNLAQLAELPVHVRKLRDAGKRTFAWLENATTIHYSVASSCDVVLAADLGTLDLPSLSLTTMHFREALDLFGAKASVVRTGDFKGAVEPFTLSEMSPQLRAHYTEMVTSMNDALVAQICAGRKLAAGRFRQIQSIRLLTPAAAKEAGLVDEVIPFGSERERVAKLLGREVRWIEPEQARPRQMSVFDLMGKLLGGSPERKASKPSLAILHLDGQILDGEQDRPGVMVSGPTVKAIAELAADEGIRAVVVRINSPGGSATASEAIRAALAKLSKAKPVIVSMGEMAASGGYWISCLGRPVYAEPGTLTGSIGVFSLKLSLAGLLKKVGVKIEQVTLDDSAAAMSINREWTPAEQEQMQKLVGEIYDRFTRLVAHSRGLKAEEVSAIAGGRVWSGAQAVRLKLVDQLGGLDAAVAVAATEAKLDPGYEVIHRPRKRNFVELFDLFGGFESEIQGILTPPARTSLREAGFDLRVPLGLLREALSGQPPKIWLLAPGEFVVR